MAPPTDRNAGPILVHLVGEQMAPNLMAAWQLEAAQNLLVASPDTMERAQRCCRLFSSPRLVEVPPFDVAVIRHRLGEALAGVDPARVILNVTGGTKLMSLAAQALAITSPCRVCYVDTQNQTLHWLSHPAGAEPLKPTLTSVEDFVIMAGHAVKRSGLWKTTPFRNTRRDLTAALWRHYSKVIPELERRPWPIVPPGAKAPKPPALPRIPIQAGGIFLGGRTYSVAGWEDTPQQYLHGGWLEEHVYTVLEPLVRDGRIFDLRIGLVPDWGGSDGLTPEPSANELDITFTDGFRFYVVECKTGRVDQTDLYKLQAVTKHFGGLMARPIFVCLQGISPRMRDKFATLGTRVVPWRQIPKLGSLLPLSPPASPRQR